MTPFRSMLAEVQLAMAGGPDAAGAQDLFDGGQQPVAILHHGAVEFLAFGLLTGRVCRVSR